MRAAATPAKSLLGPSWAIALDPGRRDGRLVAESAETATRARHAKLPASLDPGFAEALRTAGIERLYSHQAEALRASAESNLIITSGTASGKSLAFNLPVLDGIARDPKQRALYLYPTKALAQDQARKLAELRPPGLREAIYDGDTPREERPAIRRRNNLVLTNPDMLHVGLLPHHKQWGDFLANLGWVVVDEAHTYRGVFGSHVANVLRRLRRAARAYGAEPRFLMASATIANPARAGRAADRRAVPADRRRRRPASRSRHRALEPAADRRGGGDPALGALRGRRPARRPRLSRRADDLLSAQPARDRADPAIHPRPPHRRRQGRAGAADRPLPGRLHAAAAAPDRGRSGGRRAAGGSRHRRARARDRRRRARRGDLRHLPGHGCQPAPDVGPGGAAQPRACPLRRRPGRARPVLLPPPGGFPPAPGRGGDPRPRKTSRSSDST